MTKKQLKQMLIEVRNGAYITPILEKIWEEYTDEGMKAENYKSMFRNLERIIKELEDK